VTSQRPLHYIDLINEVTTPLPPIPIARMAMPPWQPLAAHLAETRVMLVSSAGVHFRTDPPFAPVDDLTFRQVPADTDPRLLRPSHPSPIRRPGLVDLNVVHPAQRLAELAAQGHIGGVTDHHLSMLGAVKSLVRLVTEMGPAMAADAKAAGAGLVMLVPLCPACHQAIGLLARVLEREGITTVTVSGACDITELVRPPRAAFLNYPLGNSVGRPNEPDEQRAVCLDVLRTAETAIVPGEIVQLDFTWPDPAWAGQLVRQYRDDADTVKSQRSHEFTASGVHFAAAEVATVEAMGRDGSL
jgi:D-proline reductase (dithiol) PrdB